MFLAIGLLALPSFAIAQTIDLSVGAKRPVVGLGVRRIASDAAPCPVGSCGPDASLSVFRIEVSLPRAAVSELAALGRELRVAVESEVVPGADAAQTPPEYPPAHLRKYRRDGSLDPRGVSIRLEPVISDAMLADQPALRYQTGSSRFVSPWIVAVADPRASIHYQWPAGTTAAQKTAAGCVDCERPSFVAGKTEADGVYEIYTAGRSLVIHLDTDLPDANLFAGTPYTFLGGNHRLEQRLTTIPATTVRPTNVLVAAQHPAVAAGLLQETTYVHSGELETSNIDLDAGGRAGWSLVFDRTYRSRTIGFTPLGSGWTSSLFRNLRALPNDDVEYRDSAGETWLFRKTNGSYVSPRGLFVKLLANDRGWTMTDQRRRITEFDALGRVTLDGDEFYTPSGGGNAIRYLYNARGQLSLILDANGRSSTLSYESETGLLHEIEDWRGRKITCGYDHFLLKKVELPQVTTSNDGLTRPTMQYRYFDDVFPVPTSSGTVNDRLELATNLEAIIDPNEITTGNPRVTFAYGSPAPRDQIANQIWGSGETASFTYINNGATTTDVLGQQRTYVLSPAATDASSDRPHIQTLTESNITTAAVAYGQLPTQLQLSGPEVVDKDRTWTFSHGLEGQVDTATIDGVRTMSNTFAPGANLPGVILQCTTTLASGSSAPPCGSEVPAGAVQLRFDYQPASAFVSAIEANGLKVEQPEAWRDNLTTTATNSAVITKQTFDSQGRITSVASSGGTDSGSAGGSTTVTWVPTTGAKWALGLPKQIDHAGLVTSFDYPTQDQVVRTSERGVVTTTDYDSWNRPAHVVVVGPEQTLEETYGYDTNGRLRLETRRHAGTDVTTLFDYDLMGRQTSVSTDHVAAESSSVDAITTFDLANHKITHSATGGAVTETEIDSLGRPIHVLTNTGTTPVERRFAYDLAGHRVYESDTFAGSAAAYDIHGRLIALIHRDGTREKIDYDAWGHPTKVQELTADGTTVTGEESFTYTPAGALQSSTTKIDSTRTRDTSFVWDGAGRVTGVSTNGRAMHMTYDAAGRAQEMEAGAGSAAAVTGTVASMHYGAYDGALPQQLVASEAADSYTSSFQYNTSGDVVKQALGNLSWSQRFDEDGNVTAATPPARPETTWSYDSLSAMTTEQKPDSQPTKVDWHKSGSVFHYIDPTAETTTEDADLAGRPLAHSYADNTLEKLSYQGPRVKSATDRQGRTQVLTYNTKDQLVRVDREGGEQIEQIDYDDATGRAIRWTNKDAAILFSDFDLEGRPGTIVQTRYKDGTGLTTKQLLDHYTMRHRWNEHGEPSYMQLPSYPNMPAVPGWTTWLLRQYDSLGNLKTIERVASDTATNGEIVANATFRNAGRPDQRTVFARAAAASTAATPIVRTYAYEPSTGRLQKLSVAVAGHEVAGSSIASFDGLQIHEAKLLGVSAGERTSQWNYDSRSRLASATIGRTTTESLTDADFRAASTRMPRFDAQTRAQLVAKGLDPDALDPPSIAMSEAPGHKIASITKGSVTRSVTHDGSERQDDGRFSYEFDERGRITRATQKTSNVQTTILRVTYTWDDNDRMVGRRVETAHTSTPNDWHLAPADVLTDGLPADATFIWDPITDTIAAIFKAGSSENPAIDVNGGLVRQIIQGGLAYDDPVEVTVTDPVNGTQIQRLYPIYDEAVTGSLQATLNSSAQVVSRAVIGDAYGDDRGVIGGAAVDRITTTAKKNADGSLADVTVEIRVTEELRPTSVPTGARLAILDSAGAVLRLAPAPPTLASPFALQYTLTAAQWQALTDPSPVTINGAAHTPDTLSIAVTNTLRAALWAGDGPLLPAPAWATTIKPVFSSADLPVEARESLANLSQWLAGIPAGSRQTTTSYEAADLRLVAADDPSDDPSRLLVSSPFQALPFFDGVTRLSYARARWLDHETGTFLTPDAIGYHDSANLYAFCGGDPVNERDPRGMAGDGAAHSKQPGRHTDVPSKNNIQLQAARDWVRAKLRPNPHALQMLPAFLLKWTKGTIISQQGGLLAGLKAEAHEFAGYLPFWNMFDAANEASVAAARHDDYAETYYRLETGWLGASDTLIVASVIDSAIPSKKIVAYNARTSRAVAESVVRGIDAKFLSSNARFGPGVYLAEEIETAIGEVDFHGKDRGTPATHVIRYELNLEKASVLDLTNAETAQKWGYQPSVSLNYEASKQLAERAKAAGFDVIRYESVRVPGTNNYVVVNDFNEILRPQEIVERP